MPIALDQTRREWELGHRRFQQEVREAARGEAWLEELGAVTAELRRRVGQSFTLAELAAAYPSAEVWSREAIEEQTRKVRAMAADLKGKDKTVERGRARLQALQRELEARQASLEKRDHAIREQETQLERRREELRRMREQIEELL